MNSATMQQFNGFEKLHVTGPFDIEPETQIVYSIDGDIEQSSIVTIRRMPESMRPRENPLIEPPADNLTVTPPDSSAFVQFKLMKILKPQSDINKHIPETKADQTKASDITPSNVNFYDTPGLESWSNEAGEKGMLELINETNPVCVIFCASPGSFADLSQLRPVLLYCKDNSIFCALVCTNMWSSNKRQKVIEEFQNELSIFGPQNDMYSDQIHSNIPHKISFFGTGALCTMVNSVEYFDPEMSSKKQPVQGIDELIHGIMQSLDDQKLLGWCNAVLHRRSYWTIVSQKMVGFFSLGLTKLRRYKFFLRLTTKRTST
ncbi:unnamed protein product [Rotaria sp. Silwood1]|nr:unnamed protein product [Rotaria sp. Silwood1]CAF4847759.1 unnamed protein product [Rotaria sp. Silwood1]